VERNTSGLRRGGPGRPKGVPNRATVEAKEFCASIVDDPEYRKTLRRRALKGELPPAIEAMIWHYAKGKPKEQVDMSVTQRLDDEIIARLERGRLRNAGLLKEDQ
jgi:hypothetical protein